MFVRCLAAKSLTEDAKLSLERRRAQHRALVSLAEAGARPASDPQRTELEVIAAEYDVLTREVEEQALSAALADALGMNPEDRADAQGALAGLLNVDAHEGASTASALVSRPDVNEQEAVLRERESNARRAESAKLPKLGVQAAAHVSYLEVQRGVGIDGRVLTASALAYVRWGILDASVYRAARVADQAVGVAHLELAAKKQEVGAEIVAAQLGVLRARAMQERAARMLKAAEITRDVQNQRYSAGIGSLLELLDAESIEQGARRERINAERELQLSYVRFLSARGEVESMLNQ